MGVFVYPIIVSFLLMAMDRIGFLNMQAVEMWMLPGVMIPIVLVNWLLNKWFAIEAYQTMWLNILSAIAIALLFWCVGCIFGMKGGPMEGREYQGASHRYQLFLLSYIYGLIVVIGSVFGCLLQIGIHELREKWRDRRNTV